jgi:sulfotransferase
LFSGVLSGATGSLLPQGTRRARAAEYEFLGGPHFVRDFENIQFDVREFDARLGTPGLHDVGRTVRVKVRNTILPPDLFKRVEADSG